MTEPSYQRITYDKTLPSQDFFHGTLLSHEFSITEPFYHRLSYHEASMTEYPEAVYCQGSADYILGGKSRLGGKWN